MTREGDSLPPLPDDPGTEDPDQPGIPPEIVSLMATFPDLQHQILRRYENGVPYAKILQWVNGQVETGDTSSGSSGFGGFSFPQAEPFDPWENGISNAYYQIWGEEIPQAEIGYAKNHGLNVYEFIDYQRSKESFKRTELYQRESFARAGTLLDAFGFGGGFTGSAYPVTGAGTI